MSSVSPWDGADRIDVLLARCQFPPAGTPVVCGVSGGADSLALLALACAADLDVTAIHVDHGLRPDSGAAEALLVERAATRFGARFQAVEVDIEAGPDLEQRARVARHAALGPRAMTGHTADDQAETVLVNLLRGAGPAGLAAMRPDHRHPILALRRAETVALCALLGLDPVVDPSNQDPRFIRNRVRAELLPLMADISQRDPIPLLARTARHAREIVDDVQALAADIDPTDTRALQDHPGTVVAEALRRWLRDELDHPPSTAELERVMAVVRHEAVACQLSGHRRVSRRDGILTIE
ncbi:MAG: tRNA lysidine(34) synthetase TilS [Actinomycetia bacterium]|nr:tRNA lysidine(34) synthetase TilS [Actinomycetes bacterium]MCP4226134.1 tRNA lysidine(34) synthetase TilS [Actinomycetes bacterium]MCP5033005.1 tRNA lysidine(34) synthetase TilS [Actinomycetes bacterium]